MFQQSTDFRLGTFLEFGHLIEQYIYYISLEKQSLKRQSENSNVRLLKTKSIRGLDRIKFQGQNEIKCDKSVSFYFEQPAAAFFVHCRNDLIVFWLSSFIH